MADDYAPHRALDRLKLGKVSTASVFWSSMGLPSFVPSVSVPYEWHDMRVNNLGVATPRTV